ncbi:MAG: cytochrome c family protein, partial [Gammaproteobacteria bacterium]|nr:cytochrome c family protein [Gammaproteobacteria bacterium]
MKLTFPKGLFLTGLVLLFSNTCLAEEEPCEGRTCLDGPGEAEVIAGTDYEHTLFDSADKKCQHCHNDLYDTWKTSMHAQSWKDPIFQSKYQDFLRLQISKIGSKHPVSGIEYKPVMVTKAAQVCIKCHAPTAYYSDDYQVLLNEVGDMDVDEAYYQDGQEAQINLAPAFDPTKEAVVSSMAKTGMVYTASYHIGHSHNQEGINCAFCHSMETVRMMNGDKTFGDGGQYKLVKPIKMGPNGQVVVDAGTTLNYSADASTFDMNAFFALIGPEKYFDFANTPTDSAFTATTPDAPLFDQNKMADGRYTMKSIPTGYDADGMPYYTGGPFYGPFGVTGVGNSNLDDATDREALVNPHFVDATEAADGDKFTSEHHFAAYGKALCLSCHQRSSLALNPEFDGIPGITDG